MEKTLKIINEMQKSGIFNEYAIGGGIAALFYIEPVTTFDLDIFVILPGEEQSLAPLTPLYAWLAQKGHKPEKEHVVIEGVPVQFIPAYNDLVKEAVTNAVAKQYESTATSVIRPEYLLSIMLQTGRAKDREKALKMMDQASMSKELLESVIAKHHLEDAFRRMKGGSRG